MDSNEAWNFEKYNICGQYYLSVSWLKVDFYFHILYQASMLLGMNKWLECDTGIPLLSLGFMQIAPKIFRF